MLGNTRDLPLTSNRNLASKTETPYRLTSEVLFFLTLNVYRNNFIFRSLIQIWFRINCTTPAEYAAFV